MALDLLQQIGQDICPILTIEFDNRVLGKNNTMKIIVGCNEILPKNYDL